MFQLTVKALRSKLISPLVVAVLATIGVSAPTASASRYVGTEGPEVTTKVIEAPKHFDLAGLAHERRHYEIRARKSGGPWTEWAETANGEPVWFGGMDELQIRTHGWRAGRDIDYVAVPEPEVAPHPMARRGMPDVITRDMWGANKRNGGCKPRRKASLGRVKAGVVHHTVSAVNYSEAEAASMVLGICRFHRNSNGWDDIGYNALVDRFGNLYEGRAGGLDQAVVGAQAQGVNAQTTGIAAIGTHTSQPASKKAINAISRFLAWKLPIHGHDTTGKAKMKSAGGETARYPEGTRFNTKRIFGHRVSNLTACPGDALFGQIRLITKKVQRKIDGSSGIGG